MPRQEELDNWFTYHPPVGDQVQRYADIRAGAKAFAELLNALVPECADKTAAFRLLRQAVMTANQGIACYDKQEQNV